MSFGQVKELVSEELKQAIQHERDYAPLETDRQQIQ